MRKLLIIGVSAIALTSPARADLCQDLVKKDKALISRMYIAFRAFSKTVPREESLAAAEKIAEYTAKGARIAAMVCHHDEYEKAIQEIVDKYDSPGE